MLVGLFFGHAQKILDNGMNGYDISKDSMLLLFLYRILIMSLVSLSSAQNKIGMTY